MKSKENRKKDMSNKSKLSSVKSKSKKKVSKNYIGHHGFSSKLVSVMKSLTESDVDKQLTVKKISEDNLKESKKPIESISQDKESTENSNTGLVVKSKTQSDSNEKPKKKKKKNSKDPKGTEKYIKGPSEEEKSTESSNSVEEKENAIPVHNTVSKDLGVPANVNEKKKGSKKKKKITAGDPNTQEERTIFVGNIDIKVPKRKLLTFFSKYGQVEAVRIRCAAPSNPEVSKKEAVIKHNVHPSRSTVSAYVRFNSEDMVDAALKANGTIFEGNHMWIDRACQSNTRDRHCAVFVGNLPFECEEEDLFKHFEECGPIANVRIIRDKKFSSGKGFGYINFQSSDTVEVALTLNGKLFMKRNLRIQRCVKKVKPLKKKDQSMPQSGQSLGFMKVKGGSRMSLKFMKNKNDTQKKGQKNGQKNKRERKNQGKFSGQEMIRSDQFKKIKKEKKKPNKGERRKHFLSQYLTGTKPMKRKTT